MSMVSTFATVDGNSRVYIVVQHIQTEEFFLERAPILGCWGLAYGPELAQFTSEYKVPINVGCGGEPSGSENINYLTCAKVIAAKESLDYSSFSDLKLDISNCNAKNNPKFITMVRTAAKLNFHKKIREKKSI
jgi:hypothetical protein